jgi:hypothetical protein
VTSCPVGSREQRPFGRLFYTPWWTTLELATSFESSPVWYALADESGTFAWIKRNLVASLLQHRMGALPRDPCLLSTLASSLDRCSGDRSFPAVSATSRLRLRRWPVSPEVGEVFLEGDPPTGAGHQDLAATQRSFEAALRVKIVTSGRARKRGRNPAP